jgi:predicted mannosyl-3-phosphoglycerate phosphatase (HAD superfamily)
MSLKIGDFGLAKQNNVQQELAEEIKGLKRQQWSLADLQQYNNITTIQSKDHLVKKQLKAQLAGCN